MPSPSILSVDVEDYFQVEAFAKVVRQDQWSEFPSRVEANTHKILDLFDECHVKGTFFILGWVADRFPHLVKQIVDRGHEPACHSYWHRLIYSLSPQEFREDTLRAKACIEQAGGKPIFGYRAPSFSIVERSLWALEVLVEAGFSYDSSVFPVKHDTYGIPDAPRSPYPVMTPSGPIVECPMTTFRVSGSPNLPVGGGGYLRILPTWYTRLGLARARQENIPLICYIHPWEVDPEQPRIASSWKSRLRHYTNLGKTCARLKDLIDSGRFTSFEASGLVDLSKIDLPRVNMSRLETVKL